MRGNDGNERRDIISGDGDKGCDISVEYGRCGSRSQKTSHYYSRNHGETVDGDLRGGYRYQTSHSSSHNPVDHGKLLHLSVASNIVHESLNDNGICGSRGDDVRHGIIS